MTYTIDAKGKILGRIATEAAHVLRGKHISSYEPHKIPQHKVTIMNAAHVCVTGNKRETKIYKRFSGYPGGLKETSFEKQLQKDPRKIIEHAVRGMLPNNKLRAIMMRNLTVQEYE
jgi:large subunit ribosomal protein L13